MDEALNLCANCNQPVPYNKYRKRKYCCIKCKRNYLRLHNGCESTKRQYELISGNWPRYFNRLCARSFSRQGLTKEILIEILEKQNYKCALSGVPLTCNLQKGVICKTNASIDRINPKGEYTIENIQLVCAAINKFRIDLPIDEFIEWCKKVAEHAIH